MSIRITLKDIDVFSTENKYAVSKDKPQTLHTHAQVELLKQLPQGL